MLVQCYADGAVNLLQAWFVLPWTPPGQEVCCGVAGSIVVCIAIDLGSRLSVSGEVALCN